MDQLAVQQPPLSPLMVPDNALLDQLAKFVVEGFLVLQLPEQEVPAAVHATVRRRAENIFEHGLGNNIYPEIPELGEVLAAPSLVAALEAKLGFGYRLHRHRHLHVSRGADQPWHKDSYWGWRRMRSHRPRWLMVMYYPQDTVLDMGPTALLPGSQYLAVDHEKGFSRRNCAGEDCCSKGMRPASDEDNSQFAKSLDSSLKERFMTVKAGSVALMHYDLFHRGSKVRVKGLDNRYMFKFQFYRVTEPLPRSLPAIDAVGPNAMRIVHEETLRWLGAERCSHDVAPPGEDLLRRKREMWSDSEAVRIAAAYAVGRVVRDAEAGETQDEALACLVEALSDDQEALRRAASFGLVTAGAAAEPSLIAALRHKSQASEAATKYALWALGEIDTTSSEAAEALLAAATGAERKYADEYKAVLAKATATAALGLLAQRAHRVGDAKLFKTICDQLCATASNTEIDNEFGDLVREEATLSLLLACEVSPGWAATRAADVVDADRPGLVSLLTQLLNDENRYVMGYAAEALLGLAESDCEQAKHALQAELSPNVDARQDLRQLVQQRRCPRTNSRSQY